MKTIGAILREILFVTVFALAIAVIGTIAVVVITSR